MPDSQQQASIGWCRDKTDLACVDFLPECFFSLRVFISFVGSLLRAASMGFSNNGLFSSSG